MSPKKYTIFLNGEYPATEDAFHRELIGESGGNNCTVVADGAIALFERLGLAPEIIVADFDSSAPPDAGFHGEIIRLDPDKDKTDGELALELALERGAEEIALCGYRGGVATDQILGNILLLQKAASISEALNIYCLSAFERVWLVSNRACELFGEPGETVSIVALDERIQLSASGLRYSVNDLTIKRGSTTGLSNTLLGNTGRLTISGSALIFQRRKSPTD